MAHFCSVFQLSSHPLWPQQAQQAAYTELIAEPGPTVWYHSRKNIKNHAVKQKADKKKPSLSKEKDMKIYQTKASCILPPYIFLFQHNPYLQKVLIEKEKKEGRKEKSLTHPCRIN